MELFILSRLLTIKSLILSDDVKFKDLGLKAIPCDKEEINHQNGVEIYELFNGYIFV